MKVIKHLGIKRVVHTTKEGVNIIQTPATHIATHRTEGRRFIEKKCLL